MDAYNLQNIDPEDLEEVLIKVEDSFGFRFGTTELKDIKTFGELCDIISSKVNLDHVDDCTSQQAFYKVREAICSSLGLDKTVITPATPITQIFPRTKRRQRIKRIEKSMGFKLKVLQPPAFVPVSLIIIFIISFIGLFINWKYGVAGLVFSIIGLRLAAYFANEIRIKTIGELADKMSKENYINSRRNPKTVNKSEIDKKVAELFMDYFDLPESALTRNARFQ